MNQFEIIEENTGVREFGEFVRVENKRSNRPDLHAFMLLDELFPGTYDIIGGASHDEIYLALENDQVDKISYEHALELHRCGVIYDSENDSLYMFT